MESHKSELLFRPSMDKFHCLSTPKRLNVCIPFPWFNTCRKSAHFRAGQILNPYPPHYRMAFALSNLLYPLIYWLSLRIAFHTEIWRQLGLPCSTASTRWVSVCLFAGGITNRVKWHTNTSTIPLTILVQASQHLWPVHAHDIYQQFTYVTHTIIPSSHPDDASRVEIPLRGSLPAKGWGLHCPPGFTQSRYQQCMPR